MDERKMKILNAIIQSYIESAEPVGSRTIARVYDFGISSATIRNEMQDLECMGYLEQPHTSAGRIPTHKAYRFYVDCITIPSKITLEEKELIRDWVNTISYIETSVFDSATKLLSELTHNFSMATTAKIKDEIFNYVQFLPLDKNRAILLIVTRTGIVEHSIFAIPENAIYADLESFKTKINNAFHGIPVGEITMSKLHDLALDSEISSEIYARVFQRLWEKNSRSLEIFSDGVGELINQPEFQDMKKIKDLISLVGESKTIASAMNMATNKGLNVRIGGENDLPSLHDYSVVQAQFWTNQSLLGTIAVIGPTRMDYHKVISVLKYMQNRVRKKSEGE